MKVLRPPIFLLLVLAFFVPRLSQAIVPIPPLTSQIVDNVGLLDYPTKLSLQAKLKAFEETKGSQVAVLIVSTTEGEAIEQFALRVSEQWKIGRKKIDDGAVLVVAKEDRSLRIEVGYALEGALPDATCKQIIEDFILPKFRQGDFGGGIQVGVDLIIKRISGEELPKPVEDNTGELIILIIILLWLIIFFYVASQPGVGRYYSSRRRGIDYWGGGFGGGGGWSSGGGGFSGGGGSFGGGGASGRW